MYQIQRIGIVGCGLSGCAIARVAALAGYQVHVCETSQAILDHAFEKSSTFFKRQSIRGVLSDADVHDSLARIHGSLNLRDLQGSDLIIEAIPEDLPAKIRVFQELDQLCLQSTIFVSHMSSLYITTLAQATQRPDKVIGLHFFHPIHVVRLVEIVKTPLLDPAILDVMYNFVVSLKKEPITVADFPGFVVNRLLIAHLLNAVRLLEAGVATQEDIDKAMQIGCGHPLGPFALMDFLGLDHVDHLARNLYREYQESQYQTPELLKNLIEAGNLGKKTGKGFYTYA